DGFGTAARFFWPTALTVSGDGTLYVADGWNSTVREVLLSSARVTTVAGSGLEIGSADGAGTAARFAYPRGLALDGSGTLYVGDNGNHTVRKVVVATGEVTTLAGAAGQSGSTDGAGSAARFACPSALVFDGSGSLFVSDRCNHTIRKVALSTALVTTVAGSAGSAGSDDGTGSAARFNDLEGLALDGMGNLFVADAGNHTIRIVVLSSREVTTLAGAPGTAGSADGTGTAARFNDPRGLAFDESGTLYVTDSVNDTLRAVVPSTAQVSTVAGTAGQSGSVDGAGTTARFWRPWAVASDGQGALFVSDSSNHTLRRIELATGLVTTIAGIPRGQGDVDGVAELARFSSPVALAVAPDGRLLATEIGGHRVRSARPIDSPTRYHALPPCRVLDTRGPGPPVAGNPLTAGASRVLRVIGTCSVPATAWAVSSNVTVVAPSSAGFLTIWPTGYPMPVASTVNFRAGQVRANNALLTLGTNGSVSVHAGLEPGKVDLILDVTGWFE
ncbi:hypothetical protein FBQ97_05235, partial [Acidobacteria bacterium ACD]|nr:hypothetical protein [Acidobacteria bacterium ACD]